MDKADSLALKTEKIVCDLDIGPVQWTELIDLMGKVLSSGGVRLKFKPLKCILPSPMGGLGHTTKLVWRLKEFRVGL